MWWAALSPADVGMDADLLDLSVTVPPGAELVTVSDTVDRQ